MSDFVFFSIFIASTMKFVSNNVLVNERDTYVEVCIQKYDQTKEDVYLKLATKQKSNLPGQRQGYARG